MISLSVPGTCQVSFYADVNFSAAVKLPHVEQHIASRTASTGHPLLHVRYSISKTRNSQQWICIFCIFRLFFLCICKRNLWNNSWKIDRRISTLLYLFFVICVYLYRYRKSCKHFATKTWQGKIAVLCLWGSECFIDLCIHEWITQERLPLKTTRRHRRRSSA